MLNFAELVFAVNNCVNN